MPAPRSFPLADPGSELRPPYVVVGQVEDTGHCDSRFGPCGSPATDNRLSTQGNVECRRSGNAFACRFQVSLHGEANAASGWIHAPLGCAPMTGEEGPADSIFGTWLLRTALSSPADLVCTAPELEPLAFAFHADGTVDGEWCGAALSQAFSVGGVGSARIVKCNHALDDATGKYTFADSVVTFSIPGVDWLKATKVTRTSDGIAFEQLIDTTLFTGGPDALPLGRLAFVRQNP
jgi:hypothetical protein